MNRFSRFYRMLTVLAIVLVLYCVLAFVIPFARNAVFWLSFAFTVIAICGQVYVFKTAFSGGDARSRFYGFPIARVGIIYLIAQLVLGFLFMALAAVIPSWVVVVVFVIILGLALLGVIAAGSIREEVERQDVQLKRNVGKMRDLQSKSASVASLCEDPEAKKVLGSLADSFKYSDPVSSDATEMLESEMDTLIDEIQSAVLDRDFECVKTLAGKAKSVLTERNRVCKINK